AVRSTSRLLNLVSALLDFEKIAAGKLELWLQATSVGTIVEQAVGGVKSFADVKRVNIEIPETDLEFVGDEERLVQVLVNLLSNAVKFSPAESTVRIGLASAEDWLEISVSDQGRGIPPEFLSNVFEKYVQVSAKDGTKGRGTGLGLPIC